MTEQQDSDGLREAIATLEQIGFLSLGNKVRQAAATIEAMSRQLVEARGALRKITDEQHEPGCKYDFCPLPECPTCPSAADIAHKALGGSDHA